MGTSALTEALTLLGHRVDLTPLQTRDAVAQIIDGQADPAQVAAFLTALRMKGEIADELTGAVLAVRGLMTPLDVPTSLRPLLDTCGTGGDGSNSVNISTATAIVVAACGVRVAKHGNRSASGNSGSAEVLETLGVAIAPSPQVLRRCLEEVGIAFLFAPVFHPALRHAAPIRKQLPFRTLFNLVGPLVNPAHPEYQLVGTPDRDRSRMMAAALTHLNENDGGNRRAYVVSGGAGLDEVSLHGVNEVEVVDGVAQHAEESWQSDDFGLPEVASEELRVSGPAESAAKIRTMLQGESGAIRNTVLANAAAALKLVGRAASLQDGVRQASAAIDEKIALDLLARWVEVSHSSP